MPRVTHVKKARKPIPSIGVEVGDSYYWWQFAFSPRSVSKTPPRPSQLTRSEFLGALYDMQDELGNLELSEAGDFAARVRELGEEQAEKIQNMPESLQYAPSGELLQERADAMEQWADELESIGDRHGEEGEDEDDLLEEFHSCEASI